MQIICSERPLSPRIRTGANASVERHYVIIGMPAAGDESSELAHGDALAALRDTSSLTFDLYEDGVSVLPRSALNCEPTEDPFTFEGVAEYGLDGSTDPVFTFNTSGGTQHIQYSLATVASYAPGGGSATNFKGGINVEESGNAPTGIDITVPVYSCNLTLFANPAQVSSTYRALAFAQTGTMNSAQFYEFAPGECLFMGLEGSCRGIGPVELRYMFAGSPNATGLTVAGVSGISKRGWDYLWVRSHASHNDMVVDGVYVEQVHREADHNLLFSSL
jgi:hypothetical protein